MTSIQPNKEKGFSIALAAALCAPLLVAAVLLVGLYNRVVNLEHEIESAQAAYQDIQAKNAETKEKILSLLSGESAELLAAERGLVKEKEPTYIEEHRWAVVSQY